MKIRPYKAADRAAVQKICVATSTIPDMEDELLLLMYCNYYIESEPENVFVLVGEKDEAVGYILCARDENKFKTAYKRKYLNSVKALSFKAYTEVLGDMWLSGFFKRKYPSHLHVDILPEAQRGGYGTKLMDALVAHLRESGSVGVRLTVGAKNAKGVNFYKKYGFKKLFNVFGQVYVFGLKID